MKAYEKCSMRVAAVCFLCILYAAGCGELINEEHGNEMKDDGYGTIRLVLNKASFFEIKEQMYNNMSVWSKNMEEIDTNDFHLSIYAEHGARIYEGKYGKRPSEISVVPGNYDIKIYSSDFKKPAFNTPVYGDEQSVEILKDSAATVVLVCRQTNAAVKLTFSGSFKKAFPGEGLKLQDANGLVMYPYTASDFCYVTPGPVELFYNNGLSDTLLYARQIPPQQMLTLNLSYSPTSKNAIFRLEKDTGRIWKTENFNAGLKIPSGAVTIEQAKQMIGEKGVMVFGFILGGDVTETTMRVKPPFASQTNIVLASSMNERNRNNMFAVELPSGTIREALNLVDNKKILGSAVVITGNIVESYYGYPGIKNTKAYSILYR